MSYDNSTMTDKVRNKYEQCHHCSSKQCKIINSFYIINDMSGYVTLVQLMDNLVNVSHAVTIYGVWIFDYSSKIALPLVKTFVSDMCIV